MSDHIYEFVRSATNKELLEGYIQVDKEVGAWHLGQREVSPLEAERIILSELNRRAGGDYTGTFMRYARIANVSSLEVADHHLDTHLAESNRLLQEALGLLNATPEWHI